MLAERLDLILVPSCRQCNSFAGATVHLNFRERHDFVKEKLAGRHKRHTTGAVWTEDELEALGPVLRSKVEQGIREFVISERRVHYYGGMVSFEKWEEKHGKKCPTKY